MTDDTSNTDLVIKPDTLITDRLNHYASKSADSTVGCKDCCFSAGIYTEKRPENYGCPDFAVNCRALDLSFTKLTNQIEVNRLGVVQGGKDAGSYVTELTLEGVQEIELVALTKELRDYTPSLAIAAFAAALLKSLTTKTKG